MNEIKKENVQSFDEQKPIVQTWDEPIKKKSEEQPKKKKAKLNHWKIATAVLAILLVVAVYTGFNGDGVTGAISMDDATIKTLEYINTNLLQGQAVAELASAEESAGLYNLKLDINGQLIDGYVTKDGKLFFPQAIDLNEEIVAPTAPAQAAAPEVIKSDKPKVELFVMSHCPYGTQAEKGILPAVDELGDQIDFELKFVYYAMHGEIEISEQKKQVCIQKEYPEQYNDYLKCFLEVGDAEAAQCMSGLEIGANVIDDCEAELDEEFGITAAFEDQDSWLSGRYPLFNVHKTENDLYGVGGSPTLVINGQQANSGRSPAQYLSTICAAFNDAPEACGAELNTQSYGPGFGYEGVGSDVAAACGI